jgi:hypothetical protein
MSMVKVSDIFEVRYGHSLELNRLTTVERREGIAFVSRRMGSNGISAYVAPIAGVEPAPPGELSCALGGNGVLSTFLQSEPYYTGRDVARLIPKVTLGSQQLLFYCMCIWENRYRYSYGRQANRTLRDIPVPAIRAIPTYVKNVRLDALEGFEKPGSEQELPALDVATWKSFALSELFDLKKGKRLTKADLQPGSTPFISALDSNNGLRQYVSAVPLHPANVITVNYNGNGVAEAYFQPKPFWASDDVNVLYPKFALDLPIAMFICTLIRAEKYRFSYGRKWGLERMKVSTIKLPVLPNGRPDLKLMRRFVETLPFSSQLN